MPINTVADLREHLELAIQVELSTVPPYLYSMYSIEDQQSEPALLIRSIVVEEMLHAALATNLLLSIGGSHQFAGEAYMPSYPLDLPHHIPPLRLDLAPATPEVVHDVFMRVEQPEIHGAPAEPDEFETLGQFYHALEIGFEELNAREDLFADTQAESQMSDHSFYQPVEYDAEDSGGLLLVHDLESAIEAIEIIVHQGEGLSDERWADPEHKELTHYHKLLQIHDGTSPLGAVRPMPTNPKSSDYPDSVREIADLFNAIYRGVYLVMNRIFSPDGDKGGAVGALYQLMADVMSQLAGYLVSQPIGDGLVAAPTFEIFRFSTDSPIDEFRALANHAAGTHPDLEVIPEAIERLDEIV